MRCFFQTKGLNVPLNNKFETSHIKEVKTKKVYIDLSNFQYLSLKLKKKENEYIKKGETLLYDVHRKERQFFSPVSGRVMSIQRGDRRKILSIAIDTLNGDEIKQPHIDLSQEKTALLNALFLQGGGFIIHKRPFHRVINPTDFPSSIFINTTVSSPLFPNHLPILKKNEPLFKTALCFLNKFCKPYLIYNEEYFDKFQDAEKYSIKGKHPIESPSIHIAAIKPIQSPKDIIWSLDTYDMLTIGATIKGEIFSKKIISITGDSFAGKDQILIETNKGACISELIGNKKECFSGNPLTGTFNSPFILDKDYTIFSTKQKEKNEFLSFLKPGFSKYTHSNTLMSKFLPNKKKQKLSYKYGGETRPFILKDIYQNIFPFQIEVEPLIKALLCKNYELAVDYGFLHLTAEDLTLCEYICPSKIPLTKIYKKAIDDYLHLQQE